MSWGLPWAAGTARLRTGASAATLLAFTAVGCGQTSNVDPNAKIVISGVVQTANGTALAGRPVRLGAGVPDDDATLAVLTAGLACTSGQCRGKVIDSKTTPAGTYSFTVTGRDTQGTFGTAKTELLSVSAAPTDQQVSGASASARFTVQTPTVGLPLLKLVDPHLNVRTRGESVISRWSTPRTGPYVLSFEGGTAVPTWKVTTTAATSTLDGRVLEGTAGQAVLSGASKDKIVGSDVDLRWRSPGLAYASDTTAPPSRGATCTYARAGRTLPAATPTAMPALPCGLTDGDLSTPELSPDICDPRVAGQTAPPMCSVATSVTITLAHPVPADLIVVRGCSSSCPVQTSLDGRTFRAAGVAATDDVALHLDGQPITAVRVELSPSGLREVSIWQPLPARSGTL